RRSRSCGRSSNVRAGRMSCWARPRSRSRSCCGACSRSGRSRASESAAPRGVRGAPCRLVWRAMSAPSPSRASGIGRVLVAVYGVLALAALGRSTFQIIDRFDEAPIAYTLSALAAVVYVLATIALAAGWHLIAWVTVTFELAGVLIVGALSVFAPQVLGLTSVSPFGGEATVWSVFGAGYVFVPLVLPVLGIMWLRSRSRAAVAD